MTGKSVKNPSDSLRGGAELPVNQLLDEIEALRDSEARFRAIFENAAVGIARVDLDGRWLEVNQRLCDIVGYSREDLMAKTFADITHPDDLEQDVRAARRLSDGEIDTYVMEKRYYRKDGSVVWANLTASMARKADGSPDYFISVVKDISARKKAEEKLRESEERFRTMVSAFPSFSFETDIDGNNIFSSDQWRAYTGMTAEETAGTGFARAIHPEEANAVLAQWFDSVRSSTPFESQCRIRAADGSYRWFLVRALPGRDEEGRIIRWAGTFVDIDDLARAEELLRESKERLAGIVSSAMDAIITVDEDQRVVLFNEAAERMFGCPAAEALGRPLDRFVPGRFRGAHTERVRRFGETSKTSRVMERLNELAALRADGTEFPIEASISKVEVGGRRLYTAILRDVTERKQAEAERDRLAQEQTARAVAEAANRSKDEFLAMVSHELRSPLNAILGYTRALQSGLADRGIINKAAAVIERNAKAQLQIIEDLLDSARIVTGKLRIEPAQIDLRPVLEAALDTVRTAAEAKGITLAARFGPGPEVALADPARLQQVMWNLLTNAIKFTPEGGRVDLRMEGDAVHICVTVSDTGKGIEPEFLPSVFDRFRQSDPSSARRFGGLGLGLPLVKHLVELHGGTITAASEGAGRGSTFTVTLPRGKPTPSAPPC